MKFITTLLLGTLLVLGAGPTFAAGTNENSPVGTWTLNAEKSKFSGPSFTSQTRTYTEAADGTTTMSFKGMTADGKAVSGGATYKYDGKDYPITGSADFDTISGKKVNGSTVKFSLKKDGKVVGTGTRTFSEHGKIFTLTSKITPANGTAYTSTMVFERQ